LPNPFSKTKTNFGITGSQFSTNDRTLDTANFIWCAPECSVEIYTKNHVHPPPVSYPALSALSVLRFEFKQFHLT